MRLHHQHVVPVAQDILCVLKLTTLTDPCAAPQHPFPFERVAQLFDGDADGMQVVRHVQGTEIAER